MNTKYKWLARFGLCKTICPKCGSKLSAKGYYYLSCKGCDYHRQEPFGHFWSLNFHERRDVAVDCFTGEFKEEIK